MYSDDKSRNPYSSERDGASRPPQQLTPSTPQNTSENEDDRLDGMPQSLLYSQPENPFTSPNPPYYPETLTTPQEPTRANSISEVSSTSPWQKRQIENTRSGLRRYPTPRIDLVQGTVLSVDYPVPSPILDSVEPGYRHSTEATGEEFTHLRYTAATCDPDDLNHRNGHNLPAAMYNRHTEFLSAITYYSGDNVLTARALHGVMGPSLVLIALVSTYGIYFIANMLYLDPWHMATSSWAYFLSMPYSINMLNVYAFCNWHDVSWGTKGSDEAASLPSAQKKTSDTKTNFVEELDKPQADIDTEFESPCDALWRRGRSRGEFEGATGRFVSDVSNEFGAVVGVEGFVAGAVDQ